MLYDLWISDDYYFDIFCPDLEQNDISFFSQEGENLVKSMIFQVEKCRNESTSQITCKPNAEIEEYLKHLKVQLFAVEDSLDLREFQGKDI